MRSSEITVQKHNFLTLFTGSYSHLSLSLSQTFGQEAFDQRWHSWSNPSWSARTETQSEKLQGLWSCIRRWHCGGGHWRCSFLYRLSCKLSIPASGSVWWTSRRADVIQVSPWWWELKFETPHYRIRLAHLTLMPLLFLVWRQEVTASSKWPLIKQQFDVFTHQTRYKMSIWEL